jgi:6-phosphogluconolactonase
VHAIERDGSLRTEPVQSLPTAEKAHSVLLDRENRFAFVPHTGPNAIFQFAFDAETGKLTPGTPAKLKTPENTGPRHIVFHPLLYIAYVDNEQSGSVTAYRLDKASGSLEPMQTVSTLPADFKDRNACAEIKIHPAGKFLYVSNRGHDSLACFRVDEQSGQLMQLGQTPTEKTPRSFDIDSTGKLLGVCGEASDRLAVYRLDQETGGLTLLAASFVGKMPWWILIVELPASK